MREGDTPEHSSPDEAVTLPPELAGFLRQHTYAALLHGSSEGTALVVKVMSADIPGLRGRVPIEHTHELHAHPASPVIRIRTVVYDHPTQPLSLESFINPGEVDQMQDYAALADQDDLLMFFFDEAMRHVLTKRTHNVDQAGIRWIDQLAAVLLDGIPFMDRDFDRAKAAVMARTSM